jgi:hypothetical protein
MSDGASLDRIDALVPIAWAGWRTVAPPEWRPLLIDGTERRGRMIVGDAGEAIGQVKWWRPGSTGFDARDWIRRRARAAQAAADADLPPGPAGFHPAVYIPEVRARNGATRAVWYGYSAHSGIVLELTANRAASGPAQQFVIRRFLPSLETSAPGSPTRWSVFGVDFQSPPGYTLHERRLYPGDMALKFTTGRAGSLVVRQVYPGDAALRRRDLPRWLAAFPFPETRRFRPARPTQTWATDTPAGPAYGARRAGWKRLPFPLQAVTPRFSVAAGVHDTSLDRLLLAEHDTVSDQGDDVLREAIWTMNRFRSGVPRATRGNAT